MSTMHRRRAVGGGGGETRGRCWNGGKMGTMPTENGSIEIWISRDRNTAPNSPTPVRTPAASWWCDGYPDSVLAARLTLLVDDLHVFVVAVPEKQLVGNEAQHRGAERQHHDLAGPLGNPGHPEFPRAHPATGVPFLARGMSPQLVGPVSAHLLLLPGPSLPQRGSSVGVLVRGSWRGVAKGCGCGV